MEKEKLNAYAARVSQANRSELVVIMYEAFLDSVKEGDAQMKQGDRKSTRLNSSHRHTSRMPSSA